MSKRDQWCGHACSRIGRTLGMAPPAESLVLTAALRQAAGAANRGIIEPKDVREEVEEEVVSMLNSKEELAALRVLVNDRAALYQQVGTLLEAADEIYRAAQPFDADARASQEIAENALEAFVEEETERVLTTLAEMADATWCLRILVNVYGSDTLREVVEGLLTKPVLPEQQGAQKENEVAVACPT